MLYQSISSVNLLQASISVIYFFNSANQTHDFHQGDSFSTSFEGLKPFAQVFVYVEFSDTFYCCFLLISHSESITIVILRVYRENFWGANYGVGVWLRAYYGQYSKGGLTHKDKKQRFS